MKCKSPPCICHSKMSPRGENGRESAMELQLTLTDAAVGRSAHVKACVAAAVLLLVHLGTARSPAEGRIVHHAPLGRRCIEKTSRRSMFRTNKQRKARPRCYVPTCLGLVLALRSTPPLGADAPVLVNPFHTGTSILARIAGTLAHDCR